MSIRKEALFWFIQNRNISSSLIFASKYFTKEEAWPKQNSWWFEIPIQRLEEHVNCDFHLLCQKSLEGNEFYHLKVPAEYFLSHLQQLTIQKSGRVSIFPSAVPDKLFQDLRGPGKLNFGSFLFDG